MFELNVSWKYRNRLSPQRPCQFAFWRGSHCLSSICWKIFNGAAKDCSLLFLFSSHLNSCFEIFPSPFLSNKHQAFFTCQSYDHVKKCWRQKLKTLGSDDGHWPPTFSSQSSSVSASSPFCWLNMLVFCEGEMLTWAYFLQRNVSENGVSSLTFAWERKSAFDIWPSLS